MTRMFLVLLALSLSGCQAIYDGEPSINGPASDEWRREMMWGKR